MRALRTTFVHAAVKLTNLHSAAALAARLKTLGVDSVMAERNPRPGDNWALRYDCMRFHIPTSFCDLPFMCELIDRDHPCTRQS